MPNGWIENTSLGKICYTKMWLIVNLQKYFDVIILKDNNGLFRTNDEIYNNLKAEYSNYEEKYQNEVLNKKYMPMDTLDIDKSFYSITSLGRTFIEACTNK
jgi:hypothetical protein